MVEARDLTEYKTDLIRQNIARHQLSNMRAVQMDATVLDEVPSESGCGDRDFRVPVLVSCAGRRI